MKLVVFGSARVDVFFELADNVAKEVCDLDKKECFLNLSFAEKIPLKRAQYLVGGNGANVAVGCKRLGVEDCLVAELGEGMMADFVYNELAKELDMKFVTRTNGIKEGFGGVITYQGERTILSYYSPERPPFPQNLGDSEWAYLTSIGENFEGFFDDAYKWLVQTKAKLVFNPGGRQIRKGKEFLGRFLAMTELLMVNREEGERISQVSHTHGKEKLLLDSLSALGPQKVVVTDGENGSYAKEGNNYFKVGVLPINAFERTGAGDSYSTGCMSALINGKTLQEGMVWGTVNAASKIGHVGPHEGLLNLDQLPEWLARAKSSNVEVGSF